MRLGALRMAGFRGVREPVDIHIPRGFMVISGRNGTGKSSICDGVEFALTGSITKYAESSEKGENVGDYVWWRGAQPAEEKYVILELVHPSGAITTITRRPEGMAVDPGGDLLPLLCDRAIDADRTVGDVCRTSIIRDEFITGLSVDLAEPERFTFVKAAVGSASFSGAEKKLASAHKLLDTRIANAKLEYDRARDRVKSVVTELSKAQAEAARGDDASQAERLLRQLIEKPQAELTALLALGRKLGPELRLRIDALERLTQRVGRLIQQESEMSGTAVRVRYEELLTDLQAQSKALEFVGTEMSELEVSLRQQQERNAVASSLAQLHEHGSRIGLAGGRCPLCGSAISDVEFRSNLAELAGVIEKTSDAAKRVAHRRAECSDAERRITSRISTLRRQVDQLASTLEVVNRERQAIEDEIKRLGMLSQEISPALVGQLRSEAERTRERLSAMERSVVILEASKAHGRVAELQKELLLSQHNVVATEKLLNKQESAAQRLRQASATLKRVSSEVVDDRLAAIRPLLAELYQRLRPHVDWPEINYLIRGDTRRFLSLRIGSGLNLRFMFSSGQRRAAGLAFLMAVSLSRPWCLLESMIFDDPVQHIDDFRALHLVESLSALRQVGRQIICTVEDSALADLLARRLRSSEIAEGAMIEMDYESGRGAVIKTVSQILPFSDQVLRSA